jgi:drug/metabolite transporter (DMT)-like permease
MAGATRTKAGTGHAVAAALLLAAAMLLWAGNFITARAVRGMLDPLALNFWRWALALLVLLPIALPRLDRQQVRLAATHWKLLIGLGATGVASFNALVYLAVLHTPALNALLVTATAPSVIALLALVSLGERLSMVRSIGIAVSLLGAVVLIGRGDLGGLLGLAMNRGDAVMALAVVAWAIYSVLLKLRPPGIDPIVLLAATAAAGVALMLPVWLWQGAELPLPDPAFLAALGYIAFIASVLAFLAWNRGVALVGPAKAGVYLNLLPVFGAALAVLLLGERVETYHIVGAGLVFAGLLLPAWAGSGAAPPAGDPEQ